MDLNPREAVVDQEPSYPSEQEEEPIDAVIVPENIVGAAMDSWLLIQAGRNQLPTTNLVY